VAVRWSNALLGDSADAATRASYVHVFGHMGAATTILDSQRIDIMRDLAGVRI